MKSKSAWDLMRQNRDMLFLCCCCDKASDRREYGTSSKDFKTYNGVFRAKKGGGRGEDGGKVSHRIGKY